MRLKLTAVKALPLAWLLFVVGVCLSPRFKELNNIFYITFIPLTLISIKDYFLDIVRTPVFILLILLSAWMGLSSSWALSPDYSDLKAIGYVLFFITGCALLNEEATVARWGFLVPIAISVQLLFSSVVDQRLQGFGPMENPLYAAQFYLFFIWFFLYYQRFHNNLLISNVSRAVGFVISVGACYLTQSRSVIFCIPLLVLMFLIQQGIFRSYKKIMLGLLSIVAVSVIALFISQKWIVPLSDNISYDVTLDTGELVVFKYLKNGDADAVPTIRLSGTKEQMSRRNVNPKGFAYTAEKPGTYEIEAKLDQKTISPWKFIQLYTKKANGDLQLEKKYIPPRALQLELSFGERTEIWPIRWQQCLEKPIFGHGFSYSLPIPHKDYFVNDSHNFFLGTLFHGGVVALIIYVGLLITCLYTLYSRKHWGFVILLVCGIITTSFDDENFFSSTRPYWLLLLFPIGKAVKVCLREKNIVT